MEFDLTKRSGIESFQKMIYSFFEKNGRVLPWRTDYNPYDIFISEIMLQQTQVERVITKFTQFKNEFPDFSSLANSSLENVLKVWQGMGYNRRAVALRESASIICKEHDSQLPSDPLSLRKLPGIGSATASSIAAFAFNSPSVFLETNIRTVYIHHFFNNSQEIIPDSVLIELVKLTLDINNPRLWYSALMDYGTVIKKKVGNLSRRSVHYKKQSPFQNSNRQLRGAVIRQLLGMNKSSVRLLSKKLEMDESKIETILDSLLKENLVIKVKNSYQIAK